MSYIKEKKFEMHRIGGKKNKAMDEMNIEVDQIKPVKAYRR